MSPLLKKKNTALTDSLLLRKYCLVSAGLAFVIMFVFYTAHTNTLIVGDATVLRMDLYHQYGPLYRGL